jgi:hypothetical protein
MRGIFICRNWTGCIPHADCFAAALAKIHEAELVSRDKELKALQREIKIKWMGDNNRKI